MTIKYTASDLAVIVPTYNRPEKIADLLKSFRKQDIRPARILIIDGGDSIQDMIKMQFDMLPIEYHACHPPGQIRQRNMGISLTDEQTPLVASFDDDIVLEENCLSTILQFWNKCPHNTAGISFNIVNSPPFQHSFIRALMGMSSSKQGKVLRSGYNLAITPVKSDLKTEWLSGGATVWRRDILIRYPHREIQSRWAICEDVIYSYPIGKRFPLYVSSGAKVRHEHVFDHKQKLRQQYYGKTATLWRLYFEESHRELSRMFFFWMILCQITARIITGVCFKKRNDLEYAIGQIKGVYLGITALLKNTDLADVISKETV